MIFRNKNKLKRYKNTCKDICKDTNAHHKTLDVNQSEMGYDEKKKKRYKNFMIDVVLEVVDAIIDFID